VKVECRVCHKPLSKERGPIVKHYEKVHNLNLYRKCKRCGETFTAIEIDGDKAIVKSFCQECCTKFPLFDLVIEDTVEIENTEHYGLRGDQM